MAADDAAGKAAPSPGMRTRLVQLGRAGTHIHGFVNPPVLRGSTVLQPTVAARRAHYTKDHDQALVYGLNGSATHFALEDAVAAIEGGTRCQILPSGLAAVSTALLAYLGAGEHCLAPDSLYQPSRSACDGLLRRMGIETTYYPPTIDPAELAGWLRPNTKVVFAESPGSHTFEVQDVPALAAMAHAHGAKLLLDNTWGILHFQPFRHGVDASIQALTKYAGGHSDLLLGAIITANEADWTRVRATALALGQYASPDDCWLALRGIRTLAVRLEQQMQSALRIAAWLQERPEVLRVLYPALSGAPGHALWRRDFTGACSLFGIVLRPAFSDDACSAMIDGLRLFGIGASWGGFESLILPSRDAITRSAGTPDPGGPALRLHIGLEDPEDLIADLDQGFAILRAFQAPDA